MITTAGTRVGNTEAIILQSLVDGPQPKKAIPAHPDNLSLIGHRMERRGLLTRSRDTGWALTSAGYHYAIQQGFTPTPQPVFTAEELAEVEVPDYAALPRQSTPLAFWLAKVTVVGLALGGIELLVMRLIGWIR